MSSTMITTTDGAAAIAAAPSPRLPSPALMRLDEPAVRNPGSAHAAPARRRRFDLGRNVDVVPALRQAAGGTPSAGSAAFRRSAMSTRLTRLSPGTSSSGTQRASSLEPPTSLRSSPPVTFPR